MSPESSSKSAVTLAPRMGLFALIIYGVGDMLGSGIYALVGKVAGLAGTAVWLAFLASMLAALLTALSYASLGSRYPKAGGAAYVTHHAFGRPLLSYVVGLAVMASGLTSMGTQAHAFARYFIDMLHGVHPWIVIAGFLALLTAINFWGIRESTWVNLVCTTVEVGGLFIVIAVGVRHWGGVDYLQPPAGQTLSASPILGAAVLAFYSFVGFEDMINVAEEAKNPRRDFPVAVIVAVGVTALIYMAVAITAVSVMSPERLAASNAPLVDVVVAAAPGFPPVVFSIIALFAITNTALLNYIMGSRLVYGMARQGLLPRLLMRLHPARRTPHYAIVALLAIVIVLVLAGGIKQLASATTVLLLTVFIVVNAALIVLKRRPGEPKGAFEVPTIVPVGGIITSAVLLTRADLDAALIAGALLAAILALYAFLRPKNLTDETFAEAGEVE